jgi:hypothetical protein
MMYSSRVGVVCEVFAIFVAAVLTAPIGLGSAVYSSQTAAPMAGGGVRDMFSFVYVSLRVLDVDGNPINGAQVKAYSEDWFARYPDSMMGEPGFALTDERGWVSFRIPVGNWTFFASAGEFYEHSRPGFGYFVVFRGRVLGDSSFILRPDDVIDLAVVDVSGRPIDGRVSVMVSDYTPIIEVPRSGVTRGGRIQIHVSRGFQYDILFLKEPSTDKVGYIIHERIGQARVVRIRPSAESLSQLTFRIYDKQYRGADGFLNLFYHNFSINGWAANWEIRDLDTVLVTPGKLWASFILIKDGWHFSFYGNEYLLSPGLKRTISFGGPLTPRLWVSVRDWDFRETGPPQMWLQISDGFGNVLDNFWDPNGREDIPIDLLRNGAVVFSENLGNRRVHSETCATPWMQIRINNVYSKESSPEYRLRVDLGPFGFFQLTGILLSDETILPYRSKETEHFILRYPALFEEKFTKAASWLESAYRVLSGLLNETINGKTTVDFHICWGFAATPNRIWFNFGDVVWDNYSPNDAAPGSQVARLGGLLHELGHVFQDSDSNVKKGRNYYDPWWFGEPFASDLAGEVIWALLGEKAGMMAFGVGSRISFDFLLKPVWSADFQHVPYIYLRKHYGTKIHRDMVRLWAGVDENHLKEKLLSKGFSVNETHVALYSYLAKQNLAWLFQPSLDISEERIAQALTILQEVKVTFIVTDRQGRPLGGWHLTIVPDQGVEVATQPGGGVTLRLLSGRVYDLTFEWMSAYGTTARYSVRGSPEELKALGRVVLPVNDVLIKVVDLDGMPVADAFVRFAGVDVGLTDREGVVTVGQVPLDNDYIITVVKEGVEVGSDLVRFTASKTSATIQVGIYDVIVVVKDMTGRPLQGVLTEIIKDGAVIARAVTDASGSAVISKLVGADYVVRASFKQFMAEARLLKGTRNTQITLDISVGVVLSIVDRQGRPLEGTRLSITPDLGVEMLSRPTDGKFMLKLLEDVTYDLTVEWTSLYGAVARVSIRGTPTDLQTRVTMPVDDVTVRVVDLDGRPVEGATVKFAGKNVGSTDSHGVITLGEVPLDNDYTIVVTKNGVEIGGGVVRFTDSRTSVTIQTNIYDVTVLVRGAAGQPITGAKVELNKGGAVIRTGITDISGQVRFEKVVGDDYTVETRFEQFTASRDLPKGTRSAILTIDLYTVFLGIPVTFSTFIVLLIVVVTLGLMLTLITVRITRRTTTRFVSAFTLKYSIHRKLILLKMWLSGIWIGYDEPSMVLGR